MKIASIVGARPQFIKLFPVSRALRRCHKEVIVHTGQHYDFKMSEIFLRDMGIPKPDYNLEAGSGSHAEQTGRMMSGLEKVFLKERPDIVLVFGDTNSTLAGAIVASKLHIPLAHVEAGLRSFNREMPEEINRVVVDHVSRVLFCPTETAVRNLAREGIVKDVYLVGDVMYDAVLYFGKKARARTDLLSDLGVERGGYLLATIHRASNTDSPATLAKLIKTFSAIKEPIVFPLHPRTRRALHESGFVFSRNVRMIDPVGYLEMLALESNARMILTDSGGVQKEAYFFGIPCVTLRSETEWTELVDAGWNCVVGSDKKRIVKTVNEWKPCGPRPFLFGKGDSSRRIAEILKKLKGL